MTPAATLDALVADLRFYGIATADHGPGCARRRVGSANPLPPGQVAYDLPHCTCGLDRIRAVVAAHTQAQGGADQPCRI